MDAQLVPDRKPVVRRISATHLILAAGFITSAVAWWMIAWPVASVSNTAQHSGHFPWLFFHMIGGTIMLFLGLSNLYIGSTGRYFAYHRLIGLMYLIGGSAGVLTAIVVTLSPAHKPAGAGMFTNLSVSLTTLGLAWLIASGMGFRAIRNQQYDSHRDWMIRSYVLAWAFVFCRIVSRVPAVGDLGGGEAFIWLSWVAPLIVCEIALQWRDGSKITNNAI
jgi:uncharacterized membrane protein YozB (DUF420 family)